MQQYAGTYLLQNQSTFGRIRPRWMEVVAQIL
jgi:hypothetical protein